MGAAESRLGCFELLADPARDPLADQAETLKQSLQEWLTVLSSRWLAAEATPIQPDAYPYDESEEAFLASAARGHQVFNAETQGSCISCHKNYGREAPYSYDEWGTIVRPRNFYDGIYRGGKRPIDLYFRVWGGLHRRAGFAPRRDLESHR